MRSLRKPAVVAMAAASALALAACGSSGGGSASSSTGKVTLTWWTNATAGQLKTVWQQAATAFHAAHPNVTIQVEPLQNEAFTTKVPPALASSNPPDIYQQWGGGQEATQIPSGKVADLTKRDQVSDAIDQVERELEKARRFIEATYPDATFPDGTPVRFPRPLLHTARYDLDEAHVAAPASAGQLFIVLRNSAIRPGSDSLARSAAM